MGKFNFSAVTKVVKRQIGDVLIQKVTTKLYINHDNWERDEGLDPTCLNNTSFFFRLVSCQDLKQTANPPV